MKKKGGSRERREEIRRRTLLAGCAALVVVGTILLCVALSHLAMKNVDTKEGVAALKALEETDISGIESQISQIEEKERQEDEEWKNRPLSEKFANAVVVGDSIAQGFEDFELLNSDHVVAQIGVVMPEMDELLDEVAQRSPQVVFLAFGHNDITNTSGDTNAFIKQFGEVCGKLKESIPGVQIYMNRLLPVQEKVLEEYPEYADIDAYNQALEQYCVGEGLSLLDASGLIEDDYFDEDGEHFKQTFYEIWGDYMAEEAGI